MTATIASVVIGGVVINLVDGEEFPSVGVGMWRVGYGDVTPRNTVGRLVGALIMPEAIAFISIVTAAITSSFVERARGEHATQTAESAAESAGDDREVAQLAGQLAEITTHLELIQRALRIGEEDGPPGERHV